MKRVLCLSSNRWNSAITEFAMKSAQSLIENGVHVVFICLKDSPAAKRLKESLAIQSIELPSFGISSATDFAKIIADLNPEGVMVFGGVETTLIGLLKRMGLLNKRIPVIRFRGYLPESKGVKERLKSLFGVSEFGFDATIVPSQTMLGLYKPDTRKPIQCVELGIDSKRFNTALIARSDKPTLMIFGRLDPVKGHAEFLGLYSKLLEKWRHPVKPLLIVAGLEANVKFSDLRKVATELGLVEGENVEFINKKITDLGELFGRVDVGVVPSIGSEFICRVGFEFLAAGRRVYVSSAGSLADVIASSSDGFIYMNRERRLCKTEESIQEDIWTTFNEMDEVRLKRQSMAMERFSVKKMGRLILEFFKEIRN